MISCCGPEKAPERAKQEKYKCESCGAVSDKPKNCCGKPMKKK